MNTDQKNALRFISEELRKIEGSLAYRTVRTLDAEQCLRCASANHLLADEALALAEQANAGSRDKIRHELECAKRGAIASGYDLAALVYADGPYNDELLEELALSVRFYQGALDRWLGVAFPA